MRRGGDSVTLQAGLTPVLSLLQHQVENGGVLGDRGVFCRVVQQREATERDKEGARLYLV